MEKHPQYGFGLVPAIIIIALAVAAGFGIKTLVTTEDADNVWIPKNDIPPTQRDPSSTTPDEPTKSYIPDVDPFPRGNEPEPKPPTDTQPNVSTEGLHRACSTKNPCATGQQCVSYEGYAGPSGPTYSTCEIRCTTDADCPGTLSCGNYADGPGYVCSQF